MSTGPSSSRQWGWIRGYMDTWIHELWRQGEAAGRRAHEVLEGG